MICRHCAGYAMKNTGTSHEAGWCKITILLLLLLLIKDDNYLIWTKITVAKPPRHYKSLYGAIISHNISVGYTVYDGVTHESVIQLWIIHTNHSNLTVELAGVQSFIY